MTETAEAPLHRGREARDALVRTVAALPDAALVTLEDESYAVLARDRRAVDALRRALDALGWERPAAVRHLEWAPIARARLEAALVGVPVALLDATPLPGEWSLRQQLAHVRLTDVRYTIATAYGARRRDDEPVMAPPDLYPAREAIPTGAPGQPLGAILAEMRRVRGEAYAALLAIPADRLQRPIEWHTAEHTVGFRLHRFAQHDLELTTDIGATLAATGFRPTRAMQVAAALVASWGEIESALPGAPAAALGAAPPDGGPSPRALLAEVEDADQALATRARAGGDAP